MKVKLFVVFLFVSIICFLPTISRAEVCTSDTAGKNRSQLEAILAQCEAEISQQKVILDSTKKQSSLLERTIAETNYKIKVSELEIKARNIKIKQLGDNIYAKSEEITNLNDKIEEIKNSVSNLIRESSTLEQYTMPEILLSNSNLSEFFSDFNNYSVISKNLRELAIQLRDLKLTNEKNKQDLESRQSQEEIMKFDQEKEKRLSENYKAEKQNLLKYTKGQESLYEKSIAQKEAVRNEIRNRIFRTVGGNEMTFGEAVRLLEPYESSIGVDIALILAVLSQESGINGIIGKNIGKCTYNQTAKNKAGTVMSDTQKPSFLSLMKELEMDPNITPVSCPIYSDGQYGGALGPAQFMPSTWWDVINKTGYKLRIGKIVGSSTPSPFTNRDAFVGTGLYLKDAQTICKTAFSKTFDIWGCSASKYYGGLSLKGSRLTNFMYSKFGYGYQVAVRATQFRKDIDLLDN
ncbi:MAG: hypothetical protein WAV11_00595 [Minisyncoccia bacterium]